MCIYSRRNYLTCENYDALRDARSLHKIAVNKSVSKLSYCVNFQLSSVSYILDICPDAGLDAQQYRCAECRKEIAFSSK